MRKVAAAWIAAVVVIAGTPTFSTAATAAPAAPADLSLPGEKHVSRDLDNRGGAVAPNAAQRARARSVGAVRFNALGTPSALGNGAKPLATGLPADAEAAARAYLAGNSDLFGLDDAAVAALEPLLVRPIGSGTVVTLRQRFGDLPAGHDGLVTVLVSGGKAVRVTSSLSRDTSAPEPATLSEAEAVAVARADAGLGAGVGTSAVKRVAVPTPADGPRDAYAVTLTAAAGVADPLAVTTYVDGRTGGVLVREDLVDFDSDNPRWAVFQTTPPASVVAGRDPRVLWCLQPSSRCVREVRDPNTGQAWDVDVATGLPTFTSRGNAADNTLSLGAGTPAVPATPSPNREYIYPFTDQWRQARCNPTVFTSAQRNDADAAIANLFAMHNRMHDFAFHLGFTESAWNMQLVNVSGEGLGADPETGRAQSNALGGSRNNANQNTGRDGLPPVTNMFLWQPQAGGAYPPCVDGDYDMTVIGHEYTHAITNRMIAGPDTGIGSAQGGAMGESWSDLIAAEYLYEYGLRAPGDSPFITGAYVTGNTTTGIRNYDSTRSPLNYSDVGYDLVGQQVHADGEIWSATQVRLRAALLAKYGNGTPSLQARCADGLVEVSSCPGNRRWAQLLFDSFLLQAGSQFSMLDMRDNMLAADLVRFGGANQELMWNAFAQAGMGRDATSGPSDADPVPSFASPYADNATVTLRPLGDSDGAPIRLYVGDYEARVTPVADTDPETALPDTFEILGGKQFNLVAAGPGYGHRKFTTLFLPGRAQELKVNLPRNLASAAGGATVSGPGVNVDKLIDETEGTNWASLDGVAGRTLTVDLTGDLPQKVSVVNVSALLRPPITGDVDPNVQNRFSALRSFAVWACDATTADCATDAGWRRVYRSETNAFPSFSFRPTAPTLNLRQFRFAPTPATHLRLEVVASQCTGNPSYAGEQDADPTAATDCATASPFATQVRVSEFQAFTR
ncbi:M36 family metallopeptidase [Phytohabitans sp. LJ34]|uniref:M36 family metallopeptidase n=1 Tax=Phytohabitans sp. LJ34 TaxID=3452217 RepID=UPI003F8BC323